MSTYERIIQHIFESKYEKGSESVHFERSEIESAAKDLGIDLPKNLGDVIYAFKYRRELPAAIQHTAPEGREWMLSNRGRSKYAFELRAEVRIIPDKMLRVTKVPDATPGIVVRYALNDEQALLTRLRYNRLVDVFAGVACYSLQNHLRATVKGIGQVETDELYVGIDKKGTHYVIPVQAKGSGDEIGVVQIEQDIALCREKFPDLVCRAIAAQFMADNVIALFEFDVEEERIVKVDEKHYKLVPESELSTEEVQRYRERVEE